MGADRPICSVLFAGSLPKPLPRVIHTRRSSVRAGAVSIDNHPYDDDAVAYSAPLRAPFVVAAAAAATYSSSVAFSFLQLLLPSTTSLTCAR